LIFPLVQGRDLGWPWWTFVMMLGSSPVLAAFVAYERRRTTSPLIEMGLFAKRAFSAGLVVITAFFSGLIGLLLVFGLYMQIGLGFSPLHAGLTFAPWALGTAAGAGLSGAVLGAKLGRRIIQLGLLVMAAGVVGLMITIDQAAVDVSTWQLAPTLLIAGLGGGLALAPLFDVVLSGVDDHEVGSASGVLNAMQQFGGSVGVAVLGTIFFGLLGTHAVSVADAQAADLEHQLSGVGSVAATQLVADYRECFSDRLAEDDPAVSPQSCAELRQSVGLAAGPNAAQVSQVLADASTDAVRLDFTDVIKIMLALSAALALMTFGLSWLLPRHVRPSES
jgi:hypothetical protein